MNKVLESIEGFFSTLVPGPLKKYYFIGFHYGVFVFGGLIGYLLYFGSQRVLFNLGIWRGFGLGVGIVLAILFTFTYHRYVTFDQKGGWKEKFAKFAPLQAVIAAINWALSLLAIEALHFPDFQATFVITFVLSLFNFAASKMLVFSRG